MRVKNVNFASLCVAIFVLGSFATGCSSATDSTSDSSDSSESSESSESSDAAVGSNSQIDEKIMASVECVVTDVKSDDILNIEDLGNSEVLITVKAGAYFYYDENVTVTNYSDDAKDIYLEYRLVDANGIVFDSGNFLELINAGETITLSDNVINQQSRELVFRANTELQKTVFDCPVTEVSL